MEDEATTIKASKKAQDSPQTSQDAATDKPVVDGATPEKAPKKRKKAKRSVPKAHVHVLATFNNTIITITDLKGNKLASASAGSNGFRGSKKGTAYAAQVAAERAINEAKQDFGVNSADVFVKGIGMGRDAAIRTLINQRLNVENIKDVTGMPHGGVRPRRPKRN